MSILWPAEDMPWSDSGLTPDILFNPHGASAKNTDRTQAFGGVSACETAYLGLERALKSFKARLSQSDDHRHAHREHRGQDGLIGSEAHGRCHDLPRVCGLLQRGRQRGSTHAKRMKKGMRRAFEA